MRHRPRFYVALPFFLAACSAAPPMAHDHRHVASVNCDAAGWVDRVTPEHQEVLNELVASRDHRVQHALWHAVRSGLDPTQGHEAVAAFGAAWASGHPLCPSPRNNPATAAYNPAGEDFLYMHHAMVEMVREAWVGKNLPCVKGWDHVPDPTEWPPPPGSSSGPKSAASLALFQAWDRDFQDPAWLKTVSLSELGFALEFTIHNNLHMRYAEDRPPPAFQAQDPDDDGAVLPFDGHFPAGWKFDDPAYQWLADPYGAAVNPVFWKIHGYVDQFIDRWLSANGYRTIAENCQGARDCYTWRGKWMGEPLEEHRGVPMPAGPSSPWKPSAQDLRFHHQRLAHQRLGVVGAQEFPGEGGGPRGPMRAAPPEDPLTTARNSVCQGK